ncbi:MAG: hypothetical protein JNN05_10475 [Candidatus Omnitrophica bacterium]|nr:hypothetical protein [Candidatus Omnitrophota bacterium]
MKNNFYVFACVTILIFTSIFIGTTMNSMAQEAGRNFSGVSLFNTPAGRLGFFEQSTGKIYLYDDNLTRCVFIGQLKELGQPIEKTQ